MELKCDVLHNLLGYSSFWEATFTLSKLSNSYAFDLIATLMLLPMRGRYVYGCFAISVPRMDESIFFLKPLALMVTMLS